MNKMNKITQRRPMLRSGKKFEIVFQKSSPSVQIFKFAVIGYAVFLIFGPLRD